MQILAPFVPHITEELWNIIGEKKSINLSSWPKWDEKIITDEEIKIVIQINGKVRGEIMIRTDEAEEAIKEKALSNSDVQKYLENRGIGRVIYVKNRLINIVVA